MEEEEEKESPFSFPSASNTAKLRNKSIARQEDNFLETREECNVTFIQGRERSYHHTFSFSEIDLRNGWNAVEIRDLSHRFVSCEFYPRVHDRIMARLNDRDEKRYSFVWTLDL